LSRLVDQAGREPNLREFLDAELIPAFGNIVRWSRPRISFEYELPISERTLSPSDFGFHNALRRDNGQSVFLDFEYFGWDDPAKTISDFLLHPAMSLSVELKRQFVTAMFSHFAEYPQLVKRVEAIYPLYGIKWCLILLNEFLPEHRLRRQFAGADNPEILQMEQLAKARRMLQSIRGEYEQFPYFND
jgi:thiamine kinase-like enzyme